MLTLCLTLVLLPLSPAQQSGFERRAIARVQRMSASALERGLPKEPFAAWLQKTVGPKAKIEWELNDCGEQTGNPQIDKGRDFPVCVGATATLPDGRQANTLVTVGTHEKGFVGQPAVWSLALVQGNAARGTKSLAELGRELRGAKTK